MRKSLRCHEKDGEMACSASFDNALHCAHHKAPVDSSMAEKVAHISTLADCMAGVAPVGVLAPG